jgi:hypothetical protein
MIAAASQFAEMKRGAEPDEPVLAPGLRRIDELLPLVLARYAALERPSASAPRAELEMAGSAVERHASSPHRPRQPR